MINVVILAAGQGKRMRSSLPKVLQPLAGTPMLGHVLASVKKLESVSRTVVVVGCGAETVKSAFAPRLPLYTNVALFGSTSPSFVTMLQYFSQSGLDFK